MKDFKKKFWKDSLCLESTICHCLDILIRLIRVANSPQCLLCIRNSNRRRREGGGGQAWTEAYVRFGEQQDWINWVNQILSVIAKFHLQYCCRTVTPTHFPRCGLFSQQVIKLLECSTDSGRGERRLWQRERGKIKRKWVVRSKIGFGKMGANVTRFVVSLQLSWVNFKLNDTRNSAKLSFFVAL